MTVRDVCRSKKKMLFSSSFSSILSFSNSSLKRLLFKKRLFSSLNKKQWKKLTNEEKLALEYLGWNERMWIERKIPIKMTQWKDLEGTYKSVIQYGLKLDSNEWDNFIENHQKESQIKQYERNEQKNEVLNSNNSNNSDNNSNNKLSSSSIGSTIYSIAKHVLPLVNLLPKSNPLSVVAIEALKSLPTFVESLADKITITSQIETILYLDDSGSMSSRLIDGQRALASLEPLLQSRTRIVKFGSSPTVLSPRGDTWNSSLMLFGWNASSGSTYMWKMIENDILGRYNIPAKGSTGKLRVIIVTDGHDTDSPGEYHGIKGMDPMMKNLLSQGYDIEFHIIILGQVSKDNSFFSDLTLADVKRYKSLCSATGGKTLVISPLGFHENNSDVREFIEVIKESGSETKQAQLNRKNRQERYLQEANSGKEINFNWLRLVSSSIKSNNSDKSDDK